MQNAARGMVMVCSGRLADEEWMGWEITYPGIEIVFACHGCGVG